MQCLAAEKPKEVVAAISRGAEYLQKHSATISAFESGLAAYTLLAAGQSADDPLVRSLIEKVAAKCDATGYRPGTHYNYEAGVDAMALAAADKVKYRDKLQLIADFLIKSQQSNGSWDYLGQDHGGDTSISQYGMLGLWAAARAGVEIPQKTLDLAANWHLKTQIRGGWSYQPLGGDSELKHSMTVAGIGTLGIARLLMSRNPQDLESLGDEPEVKPKKVEKAFGVLEKVAPKEEGEKPAKEIVAADANYKPQSSRAEMDKAMKGGLGWLNANYTVDKDCKGWHLYYLYGLERAASLANVDRIGNHDWYADGCRVLLKAQQPSDGGWNNVGGPISSTCFAVLFLARATEKLVPNAPPPKPPPKAQTFGGGLLQGGRGMPSDLTNVEAKDGNIKGKKPPATPLDQLLAEL